MTIALDKILTNDITKPARYLGNELGAVHKPWDTATVRWVLTYPEVYEVGSSNLGHIILYNILNAQPRQLCDRAYLPAPDLATKLRETGTPLFAVENRRSLTDFDILGFSLSYELGATNILEMLDLAGIPLTWRERLVATDGVTDVTDKLSVEIEAAEKTNNPSATSATKSVATPIQLDIPESLYENLEQIQILACGTSWHASLVGKYLLEQLAGIPTMVQYASEFRYAPSPLTKNTLTIGVTQSGETADTLAALEMEKERRSGLDSDYQPRLLGITNRLESSLGHLVPHIIETHAGIEIGVAATKTFVTQLVAFYCLALDLASRRQTIPPSRIEELISGLRQLPAEIELILESQERYIEELAHEFAETQDFIFLGRGINFPIALEGALKLKEISYIHAEGYPAGEMKHGPIALLDAKVPVVAIAMPGSVYEKVLSNAQEAKARDARLIGVTPMNDQEAAHTFDNLLPVPAVEELLSPILTVIPLQLLAYHIAARRGLDVDQPRNLAKSVTVE